MIIPNRSLIIFMNIGYALACSKLPYGRAEGSWALYGLSC